MNIPFNKPHLTGKETYYINDAVNTGKISGNGKYTKLCQEYFESRFDIKKTLLTTSCTDALEMAAILIDIQPGDEVIIPSYTFVSTANAFILRGAKVIFIDSNNDNPNMDVELIENHVTSKTKAIVPVHYAGVSCDMDAIMRLADKYNIFVVEDAAQAIDSYYKGKALGSIGHLAAFSFHETKNIISGEGGLLAINDERFIQRAEIIWEKGTNRSSFFRGEVDKYGWVDLGSSFLPSETISAFLWAQLENLEVIQNRRKKIWELYYNSFQELSVEFKIQLPKIPDFASNNAHMFYLITNSLEERTALLSFLKESGVLAVFHYLSLHKSPYYATLYPDVANFNLINADNFTDRLVRLPLFFDLKDDEINYICSRIIEFYVK